jgi:hypothetical protein
MRGVAVAFTLVVGCWGPPAQSTISNAPQPKTEPHASRDALVRETFALIIAGDLNGLVALAGDKDVYLRAIDCAGKPSERSEGKFDRAVRRAHEAVAMAGIIMKGRSIEVLSIDAPEKSRVLAKASADEDGCTMKVDVVREHVTVKVRVVDRKHKMTERKVELEVLVLGDRYYIQRVPKSIAAGSMDEFADYFSGVVDRVCACKDLDCSTKVMEDYTKYAVEVVKEHGDDKPEEPDPEVAKRFSDLTKKMTDCMAKFAPATP